MPNTINIEASQNPSHPHFHFSFGQVLGSALLGLQIWGLTQQSGSSAGTVLSNPQNIINITQGLASIWAASQS